MKCFEKTAKELASQERVARKKREAENKATQGPPRSEAQVVFMIFTSRSNRNSSLY